MTDQKTPDGTQERMEGGSATPALPEGLNGPQSDTESLDGGQQPRGPVDWARQQAAEREADAVEEQRETETLKATIGRVRRIAAELFVDGATHTHRAIGRQLLNALQQPEDGRAGPTVAEAAADGRAYWERKDAGEGQ